MKVWEYIYRFAWVALAGLIMVALSLIFVPQYHQFQKNQQRMVELEKEIQAEQQQLKELKQKQDRFRKDPQFVEHIAHEVGMVKDDEYLFKIHETAAVSADRRLNEN